MKNYLIEIEGYNYVFVAFTEEEALRYAYEQFPEIKKDEIKLGVFLR